ncbi:hypothetical protein [Halosimplex pelagicum]|uniref:hypothetical protein n=1 Tax=Halosimplex pelagicum TaxID=869886 RepID=UPI001C54FC94|nr:hypothetical protein [Halosimplex pelagicum]
MTERFIAEDRLPGGVSYGPAGANTSAWLLSISCDDERLEVEIPEKAMYELWVEVRGVPSPQSEFPDQNDRLVRQLVHAANGADEETLRDALEALGVRSP